MVIALIRAARARGALPYVQVHRARITREMSLGAEEAQFQAISEVELLRMSQMNAYIALRGSDNIFESSDVPSSKVQLVSRIMKPVIDHRVNKTKWVVLRWPTPPWPAGGHEHRGLRGLLLQGLHARLRSDAPGHEGLSELMARTDQVHLTGPGTDLKFSIKGIGAKECGGQYNIPDGEVFSCPVKESVEGVVQYNAPTVYLDRPSTASDWCSRRADRRGHLEQHAQAQPDPGQRRGRTLHRRVRDRLQPAHPGAHARHPL